MCLANAVCQRLTPSARRALSGRSYQTHSLCVWRDPAWPLDLSEVRYQCENGLFPLLTCLLSGCLQWLACIVYLCLPARREERAALALLLRVHCSKGAPLLS